jgi:predicted nucleotidyltransferase
MVLDVQQKQSLKEELVACLSEDKEIKRIVIFGSFVDSSSPEDMDVAIFQDSSEPYLSLAVKYRQQTRPVSRRIPLDIVPLRADVSDDPFLKAVERGETVYEQ